MTTEGICDLRAHARLLCLLADLPHPGMRIHTRTYRHILDGRNTWYTRSHSGRFIFPIYMNNATLPVPSALGPVRHQRYRSYVHVAGHQRTAGANGSTLGPFLTMKRDTYNTRRETKFTVVRTNTAGRMHYNKRRSMVREYIPVQVSWPAPKRRPPARPSLTIHIIHVARHNVLL